MKKHHSIKLTEAAAVALLASVGLCTSANAIPLSFEAPPGPAYTTGGVKLKIADLDAGTLYTASGGDSTNVANGITLLNAAPHTQALSAQPSTISGVGAPGLEDSWGIATATGIFANPGSATNPIYTAFIKGKELNAVFYNAVDFATSIAADGTQTTQSVGLRIDLYSNPIGTFDLAKLGGSAGHTGVGLYDAPGGGTANAITGNGTLEFSLISTAGGEANPLSEFETIFKPGFGGSGSAYLNVIPGVGASSAQFDTNSINLLHGGTADFSINFTTRGVLDSSNAIPPGTDWLLSSEDPMLGAVIPEPTTVLVGLGCMIPMLLGRRKSQTLPVC